MIWAFHLQHNAPINLDFHNFIQRTNMPHRPPIVRISSMTTDAHISESSHHRQSVTASISTEDEGANEIANLNQILSSKICINNQKHVPDFVTSWFQSSLDGFLQEAELRSQSGQHDLVLFLDCLRRYLLPQLLRMLERKGGFSFWVSVQVKYSHPTKSLSDMSPPFLHTGRQLLLRTAQVFQIFHDSSDLIQNCNETLSGNRSGMVVDRILKTRFKVVEFAPLYGGGHRD